MGDPEIQRMKEIYDALAGLPDKAHKRCIEWALDKIREDRKKQTHGEANGGENG